MQQNTNGIIGSTCDDDDGGTARTRIRSCARTATNRV